MAIGLGQDRSALAPGEVSRGAGDPATEPDVSAPRLPEVSAPIILGDPASRRAPLYDTWANIGRRWLIGRTIYEPIVRDAFLCTTVHHTDTANSHVQVPPMARVKFPSTSRTAIGNMAPTHFVLWEKPAGTDRLDDPLRDYPAELRESMMRIGGFTPEEIAAQCAKVGKSGDAAIPRRAPIREAVDL